MAPCLAQCRPADRPAAPRVAPVGVRVWPGQAGRPQEAGDSLRGGRLSQHSHNEHKGQSHIYF